MAGSNTTITAPGRLILGLMTFTIVFSLVGDEISTGQGNKPKVNPFIIIFGGTIATSLLTLISHAGDAGEEFATGLALIAFLTSSLTFGKPVWDKLNDAFGSSPTVAISGTTPTTPTTGVATATSLAQLAG
jgi:hypothetical protein